MVGPPFFLVSPACVCKRLKCQAGYIFFFRFLEESRAKIALCKTDIVDGKEDGVKREFVYQSQSNILIVGRKAKIADLPLFSGLHECFQGSVCSQYNVYILHLAHGM